MDEVIITVQLAGDLSQPPEVEEVREGGVERGERRGSQPGHPAEVRPEAGQLHGLRAGRGRAGLHSGPLDVHRVNAGEEGGVLGRQGGQLSLDSASLTFFLADSRNDWR